MPHDTGPEREHFGGEDGLYTEICGGKVRNFWKCIHCNWELGGKNFQNSKARIHLSGDPALRNGIISNVCPTAPDEVKQQFRELEQIKRSEKTVRDQRKSRMRKLLDSKSPSPAKQTRLGFKIHDLTDDEVDDAWGEAFFGLDIACGKIENPLFKEAIVATQRSKSGCVHHVCMFHNHPLRLVICTII